MRIIFVYDIPLENVLPCLEVITPPIKKKRVSIASDGDPKPKRKKKEATRTDSNPPNIVNQTLTPPSTSLTHQILPLNLGTSRTFAPTLNPWVMYNYMLMQGL